MVHKIVIIFGGTGVLCREIGNGLAKKDNICILIGRKQQNVEEHYHVNNKKLLLVLSTYEAAIISIFSGLYSFKSFPSYL